MSAFAERPDPPPRRRSRRFGGRRVVRGIRPPIRPGIAPDDRRGRSCVLRAMTSASRRAASRSSPSLITTTCGHPSPSESLSICVGDRRRRLAQQRCQSDPLRGTPTTRELTACQHRVSHLSAPPRPHRRPARAARRTAARTRPAAPRAARTDRARARSGSGTSG